MLKTYDVAYFMASTEDAETSRKFAEANQADFPILADPDKAEEFVRRTGCDSLAVAIGTSHGAYKFAGAERLHFDVHSLIRNWRLAMGVIVFVLSSLLYLKGIKHGELTILYPMVSLGYVWTLFWSRLFFGEPFTKNKFVGLGMILSGIVVLFAGNR